VEQNENQATTDSVRQLTHKIQQGLHGVSPQERLLSQEGKALASLFVCLVHSLRESHALDETALLENLHSAIQAFVKDGESVAAHHVLQLYVQMLVQLG
jgi:glucokinase